MFQKDLRALLSHPGVGNDTLPALKGKPILIGAAGRTSFWQWLKVKYGYTDEQVRPYTFNLAPFLADKNIEPAGLRHQRAVRHAPGRRRSGDPFARRPRLPQLPQHPALPAQARGREGRGVQRFVDASAKGWKSYLSGDASAANALIKRDNPDMTDDKIAYSIQVMNKAGIVVGGDAATLGIGAMTAEHWLSFYKDMVDCGALPAGWAVDKLFTTQFVNKKVAIL